MWGYLGTEYRLKCCSSDCARVLFMTCMYNFAIFSPACMYTFAVFSPVLLFIMLSLGLLSRLVNLSVTLGAKPLPCWVTIETTAIFTQKVWLVHMKVMAALLRRFLVCTHSGSYSVTQNYVIGNQVTNFSMIYYCPYIFFLNILNQSITDLACIIHLIIWFAIIMSLKVVTDQYQTKFCHLL